MQISKVVFGNKEESLKYDYFKSKRKSLSRMQRECRLLAKRFKVFFPFFFFFLVNVKTN